MKFGIIGTGWIAKAFADSTKYVDGFDAYCVLSRKKETGEKFASSIGVKKVFTNIEDMANCEEIDAVYIASPNALHYEQSKIFLHHGKHVICEKPICVEPEEFKELTLYAKSRKLVYMEAIMMMHFPNRKLIESAIISIGNVYSAHIDFSQRSSKYDAYKAGNLPNIFNPEMATGCLMDLGIYNVYACLYFFGIPERITSSAYFLESGADGCGTSIFDYPDKQVTLTYSKLGQDRVGSQIFGDEGTIVIESVSKLVNVKLISKDATEKIIAGDTEKEKVMSYEAADFFRFIKDYEKCLDEYENCSEFSLNVCKVMKIIRSQCGIIFNKDYK